MANLTAPENDRAAGNVTHGRAGDVWTDRIFRGVALGAGLSVLAILALIAYSTTKQAWPVFRHEGSRFVTADRGIPNEDKFGALAFIYGTLYTSVIALVIAVPVQHRHRAVHERARAAPAATTGDLPRRPARRDPVGGLRPLGVARARTLDRAAVRVTSPTRSARSPCSAASSAGR